MHVNLNGSPVETAAHTLDELLDRLLGGLPPGHAVAHNSQVVPRDCLSGVPLSPGDRVEVVTAVAGG